MHGKFDVFCGDGFKVHLLREELADEPVHIFVGAAFPRGIGMGEEEVRVEFHRDPLVLGKLLAVVGCQGMDVVSKRRQQGNHGIRNCLCGLERNVGDQRIARRALVNRNERLFLTGADDKVRLPVAEASTLGHDGRTQINRHLVGNRAASLAPAIAFPAGLLATQCTMQRATGALVGVDMLVDALVADSEFPLVLR